MWTWYLDRGAGFVAYAALWLAVATGILYNARRFGAAHRAARALHVPATVIATAAIFAHVAFGAFDTWAVLARLVPQPAYSDAWLVLGILVGVSALLLLVTATLAFMDPKRFERPWDPRNVHALAYGGFVFSGIHVIALGSDVSSFLVAAIVASSALLLAILVLRHLEARREARAA